MSEKVEVQPTSDRELVISRKLKAPRANVFRAWSEPQLLKQWFAPKPWTVSDAEVDLRAGGSSLITMKSPEGVEMPGRGVYLEIVPNEKIVFTDAFSKAWEPSQQAFICVTITLADAGPGETLYTARALHWTKEACEQHAKMGFLEGWGVCADQLEAVAAKL